MIRLTLDSGEVVSLLACANAAPERYDQDPPYGTGWPMIAVTWRGKTKLTAVGFWEREVGALLIDRGESMSWVHPCRVKEYRCE